MLTIPFKQQNRLFKNNSFNCTILSSATLGGFFFLSIFGVRIINPTYIGWLKGDSITQFLGWHFFRNEPWHIPFGILTKYHFPYITSIGFTDSIPLMAFIFKPLANVLPPDFQYIGLWLLLCFCFQGIFGALLIRVFSKNLFIQLLGAMFFISSPILLGRVGHSALSSHWLLLAALWFYFRDWQNPSSFKKFCGWLILVVLSAAIHPYISIMIGGLSFAFYLRLWLINRVIKVISVIFIICGLISSNLFMWWIVGYFAVGELNNFTAHGYGVYSANLVAFIDSRGWSTFLAGWKQATDGQYEGFSYLGLGVIILGLLACYPFFKRPPAFSNIKPLLPLFAVCTCFYILALSNKITFSDQIIIHIKLNDHLKQFFSIFRSSGRFVWPLYYLMVFLILAFLIHRNKPRIVIPLLIITLSIQLIDFPKIYVSRALRHLKQEGVNFTKSLKSDFWTSIGDHYDKIMIFPPEFCSKKPAIPYEPFAYLAANQQMSINVNRSAHINIDFLRKECEKLIAGVESGNHDLKSIYILHPKYIEMFIQSIKVPTICGKIDNFNVCIAKNENSVNPVIRAIKKHS